MLAMIHSKYEARRLWKGQRTAARRVEGLAQLLLSTGISLGLCVATAPAAAQNPAGQQSQQPSTGQPQPPAPALAQQQAAAPAPAQDSGVGFKLENADLLQVIGIIAGQLKINYIVDAAVKGTVNINTAGDLKREDLFPILEIGRASCRERVYVLV